MKSIRLPSAALLALLSMPTSVPSLRADDLPKAQPAGRYEGMAARSPFTAPTAPAPAATPTPVPAGPHWWDQMSVSSLMQAGGVYFAGVFDRSNNKRYFLESGKPDEDSHLVLTEVQWSDRADQRTITVRKGTEVAPPLRFDASAVPSTPAGPQQPFTAPRNPSGLPNPPLPPGFTGTPPPPPPSTSVVRRSGPITSRPPAPPSQGAFVAPAQPQVPATRRVRPLSGNPEGEE